MTGEAFVRGQIRLDVKVMQLAQQVRIIPGRCHVKTTDAIGCENRRRIVGGALDVRAQRRRGDGHIQPVVRGHLKQMRAARIVHQLLAGLAVRLQHRGIVGRSILPEMLEDHIHRRIGRPRR